MRVTADGTPVKLYWSEYNLWEADAPTQAEVRLILERLARTRERVQTLEAALEEIHIEAGGDSGETTYKMNGRLLRILNRSRDALKGDGAD